MQIAKYCLKSNKWKLLRRLKGLVLLEMSFCNFLDELFLVGGYVFSNNVSGESGVCLGFNTVNNDVRILSSMNEARCSAACAVFKEKAVISGGHGDDIEQLTTVEAYNHAADRWSPMPNMVQGRFKHVLTAAQRCLFC